MDLDIVVVTFNSQKWVDKFTDSLCASDYSLSEISLVFVDNNSSDHTVARLTKFKEISGGRFKSVSVLSSTKNIGFGRGNNLGVGVCHSTHILFVNIDTAFLPKTLKAVERNISESEQDVGIWELRQFPYEHPKIYHPLSLRTSWASGAAFVVKRQVFEQVGGFDPNIFMYAEDVDLSWRVRLHGYSIKYMPEAIIEHYCYESAGQIKPVQYFSSITNNLLLRYKFGTVGSVLQWCKMFLRLMLSEEAFEGSKKGLLKEFGLHFFRVWPYVLWRLKNRKKLKSFRASFIGFDYECVREGAFFVNELPKQQPLVSIIVRTCQRPLMLREALISLRNQTYKNIEILVIEDGVNSADSMIKAEFSDLNIVYKHTGPKVGRCAVANRALELATGKYCNFFDDDDLLYADHVEVLVSQLERNPGYRIACALAFETPTIVHGTNPYCYEEMGFNLRYRQRFNRTLLFQRNYLPIQTVMFERSIFLENGGMDESLEFLEDWDLWVRYALKNDFLFVEKVTSLYRVPFAPSVSLERQRRLDSTLAVLKEKHSLYFANVSVAAVRQDVESMLQECLRVAAGQRHWMIRLARKILRFWRTLP